MTHIIKLGELTGVLERDFVPQHVALSNPEIDERFAKFAKELKTIAPKANDFLYFTATMMHAAERSLLDDNGKIKKDADGSDITAHWEKKGKSMKWICSDPSIKPYANANRDIFPEEELLKAHKKWVGKPLCLDHKSSSVDMVRGLIIDTYYDYHGKRVVALCALDKKNYPDLARKVATGYAASVSMGTGVGVAICTDCGKCASVEADFCNHMRNKSCYGEINCDLNPIELSIVVSGADSRARIRRIVAATNSIAEYVSLKDLEISKLASESAQVDKLQKIEQDLKNALEQISVLQKELQEDVKEVEQVAMQEKKEEEQEQQDANDSASIKEASLSDSTVTTKTLSDKLDQISTKISQILQHKDSMSNKQAYYLGGGGVNEPAMHQVKYPKEDNDKLRNSEDKQMQGQSPFPGVGPVDGMYPGYDSFGESEEERKRRLLRLAEEQQRSLRRQAALEKIKKSYYLGTDEPTPGKPKYPKDDADSIRDKEDSQMRGQPPFPGVGNVDGLHPSPASADEKDELKRKEKYLRASKLGARFVKAANADGSLNQGASHWKVYVDEGGSEKVILTASVNQISGGRSYDLIATRTFGQNLLEKIRSQGIDKVAASLNAGVNKVAQDMGPAPMAPPAMPDMGAMPPSGKPDEEPKDKGGTGDPAKDIDEVVENLENDVADVRKAVDVLQNKSGNELDKLEDLGAEKGITPAVASMIQSEKQLRTWLIKGMTKAAKALDQHIDELKLAKQVYSNPHKIANASVKKEFENVVANCLKSAEKVTQDSYVLMDSFVNYAKGTEKIMKRVARDLQLYREAQESNPLDPSQITPGTIFQEGDPFMPLDAVPGVPYYPKVETPAPSTPAGKPDWKAMKPTTAPTTPEAPKFPQSGTPTTSDEMDLLMKQRGSMRDQTLGDWQQRVVNPSKPAPANPTHPKDITVPMDTNTVDDENDVKMMPDGTIEGTADELAKINKEKKAAAPDMSTKEGRAQYRASLGAKLAEKGSMQYMKMLSDAHGKGGVTQPSLVEGTKPSDDLAKVETLEERQKVMLQAVSAKTKKAAQEIQNMIVSGALDASQVDELVANGVDKDAVKYWKDLWGQAKDKDAKEFATDLTKEHYEAKKAEEMKIHEVKISRSYDLAYQMAAKNAIENNPLAIKAQVNELMHLNDAGFEQLKKTIDRMSVSKTASLPQVGNSSMFLDQGVVMPSPRNTEADLVEMFGRAFAAKKRF